METVREDFQTLYWREDPPPPGQHLATHVKPVKVNNEITFKAEVEVAVQLLLPHREGGHTHLRMEHFNKWRREAYPWEQSKTPLWREPWMCLVDPVQNMWNTREIPQELLWTVLVLFPKGTTNKRGIVLLDTLWKVVEALIDTCLCASLQMHNVLHGFRS